MGGAKTPPVPKDYKVHGNKGVICGGKWIDIEDCGDWLKGGCNGEQDRVGHAKAMRAKRAKKDGSFDVVIVGAGCIGASIARELAKYNVSVLVLDRDDDISHNATASNSGIVHAGYDDKPGSVRAKYCWPGNQMFSELDRDLKFGFMKNGSMVCARGPKEEEILQDLMERGHKNGVQNLRIIRQEEIRAMEPHINPEVTAALFSPDAGTVIPYEFSIALAENAADNGVDIRVRHQVTGIEKTDDGEGFVVKALNWDPKLGPAGKGGPSMFSMGVVGGACAVAVGMMMRGYQFEGVMLLVVAIACLLILQWAGTILGESGPLMKKGVHPVLGFEPSNDGREETFKTKFVINCAGIFSDKIANMVGDSSFKIKPRLGDYLLLNKNQGHLVKHVLFPCPDPVLGKGVIAQPTLWGNAILGPTSRDMHKADRLDMSNEELYKYILGNVGKVLPAFDAGEVIHAFCGARAKSDRGDWIIEESKAAKNFFNVAGIDSPGLAGSPAIAKDVVENLLGKAGLPLEPFPDFDPIRKPLIVPKNNWKSKDGKPLKVFKPENVGKVPKDQHILCKCEKVTEAEIVNSLHSSLPVDNTQAVRFRTRAGMGHCQAGEFPHCEQRCVEVITREKKIPMDKVGRRPWPATSILPQRWLTDEQRNVFRSIYNSAN